MIDMAEVSTPSIALNKIDQHLTCPVCLSQYQNPKTLPCLHSFCLNCILQMRLDLNEGKYFISCPSCRKLCEISDKGPADLPTAFFINNLLDIQDVLKQVSHKHKIFCDNCDVSSATSYCKQCNSKFCADCLRCHNKLKANTKHHVVGIRDLATQLLSTKQEASMNCTDHNEPLKIFCNTCQELICRDCTVRRHRDHDYDLIKDCFPKHRQQVESVLELVKEKIITTSKALKALITREGEVTKQVKETILNIRNHASSIIELVQEVESQLVSEVGSVLQHKMQLLGQQKQEMETGLLQLKSCQTYIEQCLTVGSQRQILLEKQKLIQHMEVVNKEIDPNVFQPIEEANIAFNKNEELLEMCKDLGKLEYFYFSKMHISLSQHSIGIVDRECSSTVSVCSNTGSPFQIPPSVPLTCHLIPPDKSGTIMCNMKEMEIGKYKVSFTPLTAGDYQVKIQAGDIDIINVPIPVASKVTRGKPLKIILGATRPCGVAVNKNGIIAVAERNSHCITIYNREGKKIRSFGSKGKGKGQFSCPCGVVFANDGHILVTDNHRLRKVTLEGRHIMSVGDGTGGASPLQFSYPSGIAVHPTTGQIFVVENGNNRIHVVNKDFGFSHFISSQGTVPGRLTSPWDISLDSVGRVYVANGGNRCIDVFTSDGKYLKRFGSKGSGRGQLNYPSSISIDTNNLIYVTEYYNNRISVFNISGEFIEHISDRENREGKLKYPCGIAIDSLGALYVSDSGNNRVMLL